MLGFGVGAIVNHYLPDPIASWVNLFLLCFYFVLYVICKYQIKRSRLRKESVDIINSLGGKIHTAVKMFNEYQNGKYFNHRKWVAWNKSYADIANKISFPYRKLDIPDDLKKQLEFFFRCYRNGVKIKQYYNEGFCQNELLANKRLFDTVESYPLTDKQREAIVHDEDSSLVIAGAGTGKTTTIVGKVAYLVNRLGVQPSEILLLAFTRKASEEMAQRIENRIQATLDVKTFHKFGLDIISSVRNARPAVFDGEDNGQFRTIVTNAFNLLRKNPTYQNLLANYLAYYLKPYKPQHEFNTSGEYLAYLKSNDIKTFKGEVLKSYEEVEIANFLFMNNINYQYETPYQHDVRDKDHRQYMPDFYLPDYDIYIEHFGVDKDGNVPKWFKGRGGQTAKEIYNKGIIWKRSTHTRFNTKLVETFSYEKREGTLCQGLRERLLQHGVEFRERPAIEILNIFSEKRGEEIPLIIILLMTFLNLFKSNNFTIHELMVKAGSIDSTGRYKAFLKLFQPIFEAYQEYLVSKGQIDFSDMIVEATRLIDENAYISPYKYILIDEFQDISIGRYNLIKSLIQQNPEQKLFAVGDDWQSVYRFTGSDLSIITDFEGYFGFTKKTFLDTTFRFHDKIASFTSKFIQKNPRQLKKTLTTQTTSDQQPYKILFKDSQPGDQFQNRKLIKCLHEIEEMQGNNKKVFILGRYNHNRPNDSTFTYLLRKFPRLSIEFLTVHSSKGLEADYVIIDSVDSGKYGFPTEIVDDQILNLVLTKSDGYQNAVV